MKITKILLPLLLSVTLSTFAGQSHIPTTQPTLLKLGYTYSQEIQTVQVSSHWAVYNFAHTIIAPIVVPEPESINDAVQAHYSIGVRNVTPTSVELIIHPNSGIENIPLVMSITYAIVDTALLPPGVNKLGLFQQAVWPY